VNLLTWFACIIAILACAALGVALWRMYVLASKFERRDVEASGYASLCRDRYVTIVDLRNKLHHGADVTMCEHVKHAPDCNSFCEGLFRCEGCHKLTGACYGAADEHPDLCDDCAFALDSTLRFTQCDPEDGQERVQA
jgi:hypothetical protein